MKISALSHTRAVRLCVERGPIYSTEQLLWRKRGERTIQDKSSSALLNSKSFHFTPFSLGMKTRVTQIFL